jgi:hypothetical protein
MREKKITHTNLILENPIFIQLSTKYHARHLGRGGLSAQGSEIHLKPPQKVIRG